MDVLNYILMCIPAVFMIIIGFIISSAKKSSTMTSHHFAKNFNIKPYSKKIIKLFTITGIMFSLSGIMFINNLFMVGIIFMFITLIVFIISFAVLQTRE